MKKKLMKRILAVVCAAAIAATQIPYGTLNTIYAAGVEEGMGDPEVPENGNVAEDPEDPENGNVAEDPETETTEAAVEPTTEAPVEMTTEAPVEITTEAGTETTTEEVNPPETPEDKTTAPVIKDITGLDGAYVDTAYVGETVTLTADITPGTDKEGNEAVYLIGWSGDIKGSSTGNTVNVDTSSAGTKTVTLTVQQEGVADVTFSKSVDVKLKITYEPSATNLNETHYNDKITFSVPEMEGYTYTWTDTINGKEITIGNGTTVNYKVEKTGIEHKIKVVATKNGADVSADLTFTPQNADFKDIQVLIDNVPVDEYYNKIDGSTRLVDGDTWSNFLSNNAEFKNYVPEDKGNGEFFVFDKYDKKTNPKKEATVTLKDDSYEKPDAKYSYEIKSTLARFDGDPDTVKTAKFDDESDTVKETRDTIEFDLNLEFIGLYKVEITCKDKGNTSSQHTIVLCGLVRRPLTIKRTKTSISKISDGNTSIKPEDGSTYFTLAGNKADCDKDATVDTSNLVYGNALPGKNKEIIFSESESYYKVTGLSEGRAPLYYFGGVPSSLTGKIEAAELDSKTIDLTKKWDVKNGKSLTNTNGEEVGKVKLADGAHFQNNYFNTNAIIQAGDKASLITLIQNPVNPDDFSDSTELEFKNSTAGKNTIEDVYLQTKDGIIYGPFTVIYNFDNKLPEFKGVSIESYEQKDAAKPSVTPTLVLSEEDVSFTEDGALIIAKEAITIHSLQGNDDGSGVNTNASGIYVDTEQYSKAEKVMGKNFASEVTITDPGKYYVYIKVEDNAGNALYLSLDGRVLKDNDPPTATIDFRQNQVGGTVKLDVTPHDDSAGIRSVELHVYDGGVTVNKKTSTLNEYKNDELVSVVYTDADNKEIYSGSFNKRKTQFEENEKISVELTEKGAQQSILLVVTDWAGNTTYYGLKDGKNGKIFDKFNKADDYKPTIEDTFSIYGENFNPEIKFEYMIGDKKSNEKSVERKKQHIFVRRTGINVTFTNIQVPGVDLEFSKTGSKGDTEKFTYEFDSYDSSKHTYICEDALATDVDGEYSYSVALTTVADGEYSLKLTVPELEEGKQIAVSDIDEFAATSKEKNKTVYTDSFIKDGTAPVVTATVDKSCAEDKDEIIYYYGLSDGFTVKEDTEDTNCEDIEITVKIIEEYWYDEDIPTLVVNFQQDPTVQPNDPETQGGEPEEEVKWKRDGDTYTLKYTIKGKANHTADGTYTFNLTNERGEDGELNKDGTYLNYCDYYDPGNNDYDENEKDEKAGECIYEENDFKDKKNNVIYTYVIDTTRPVASYFVEVDEPVPDPVYREYKAEKDPAVYFNKTFTESFVIVETNYDEKNVILKSHTFNSAEKDAKEEINETFMPQTFSEEHKEDGVYWYELSGTDLAGNLLIFEKRDKTPNDKTNYITEKDKDTIDTKTETDSFISQQKVLDTICPKVTYTITELKDPTHSYVGDADYYNKEFTGFTESFTVYEVNYLESLIGFDETSLNGVKPEQVSHDDNDNHIYSVEINTEGEYKFTFSGTDKAGNPIVITKSTGTTGNDPENGTGSYTTGKKIYDVTEPTFKVTDMTQPAGFANVDGTTVYFNWKDVSTTFEVTDSYLDVNKVKTNVAYEGKDYARDPDWAVIKLATTAENGNGPETKITLTAKSTDLEESEVKDGVYRFEIAGEDRAGNKLAKKVPDSDYINSDGKYEEYNKTEQHGPGEYWTYNKIIDTEAPKGEITIGSYYDAELAPEAVLSVNNSEPYRSETSASGTVSAADLSPVKISYPITSTVSGTRGMETGYGYNPKSGFEMNGQQVFYLDITLTDRAGNVTGPIKTNSIYLDVEAPTVDQLAPTIQIVANANSSAHGPEGNPLFNSSVPFLIVVTDPNATAQSSGLDEITYEILVDGIVATTGTLKGKDALKFPAVGSKTYTDPTLDYSLTYNNNEVVADSSLNSNNIMIRVHASDHAQNKSQREYNFGIDIVSPTISVTYDNNDVQNERYFKADRTATIVVTERNFDPSRINVSTNGGSQSGWSFNNNGGNGDNDTWTSTVTYSSDGDYTFSVAGSDILGHEASDISYGGTAPQSFTVDKTVPVITISFDHTSGYQNSKYYNQTRTGTVQIQEHNFRSSDAKVSAPGTISRGDQPTASMGGWGDSGDSHSMNITFDQDGDYSISAEYTDLAGNPAVPVKSEDFTIDKTAPVIEFDKASVTDKKAYSGVIAPRLLFSDTNYDPNGVTFTLTGIKNSKGKDLRLTEVFNDETGYGGSISYENFANIKANDDIYTARGTITDRAGNTSEVSITFSVNRFGSTWDYNNDKTTEGLLFKYTNQEKNVFLREINPDEVTVQSVVLTHDSEIRNLEEGKDYKVTANTSEGWKEYVYEFLAENFENEGTYSIVVQTQDEANNINTNSSVKRDGGSDSVPLQYSVDKTNPYATLDGVDLEEKRYSQDSLPLFTRLFDNLSGVYKVEIFIYPTNSDDDDPARMTPKYAYENTEERAELEEILQANNGEVPFEIGANNTPQDVRIVTYDAAGNISETVLTSGETFAGEVLWEGVLVTRNIASQYFYNRPLFFGSLGALGAGGIFLFLFLKRRKKDEDKENAA